MEISRQTETEQSVHVTYEPANVCLSTCKLLDGSESMQTEPNSTLRGLPLLKLIWTAGPTTEPFLIGGGYSTESN